jgi:hypothetical protein
VLHPDQLYETVRYEQQARIHAAEQSRQARIARSDGPRWSARSLFAALHRPQTDSAQMAVGDVITSRGRSEDQVATA